MIPGSKRKGAERTDLKGERQYKDILLRLMVWPLNSQLHQDLQEEFRGPLMSVHLKDRELEYLPITPKLH